MPANVNLKSGSCFAKYKNNGKDGYPSIRRNFRDYFKDLVNDHEGFKSDPGAERGVFFKIYEDFR